MMTNSNFFLKQIAISKFGAQKKLVDIVIEIVSGVQNKLN